ncbi:phosphotransferase [Mycobacterium sp. ACS4331]|uniref:phosphotransferase enzyme family protein n=1 Tax=Mycobacterium sp. ACS4331 TaxID=1834121 RepID=UPI000800F2D5|nr:phosphotransferase [Mycobacterium sp. ACS4331]OBF11777.1 hypothetical protein A5727_20015 [Mycobacterium sp. ACS4331]
MATTEEALRLEPQARDALARYELPEPVDLQLLTFSENAVFWASFESREPVVVRLHSIDYHTKAAVESEMMWLLALARDTDLTVSAPLSTPSGELVVTATHPGFEPRLAAVFRVLPGSTPTEDNLVADYRMLGHTTARLQLHATSWTPPPTFERLSWDLDGAFGPSANWGSWREGPNVGAADIAVLQAAEDLIRRRLTEYGQGRNRYGLIHSDLRLGNVLVDGDAVAVIDFDDCGFGWLLYDLASALTFIEDDPLVPDLIDSWLAGYTDVRPLDEDDIAIIPTLIMMRRMVILSWLGSRPGTELWSQEAPRYSKITVDMANVYLASSGAAVLPG